MENETPTPDVSYMGLIRQKGFLPFLSAEFLAAIVDSGLQSFLVFWAVAIGKQLGDESIGDKYTALVNTFFSLPYLIFLGYAGYLADKVSKKRVIVWVKIAQVVLCIPLIGALYYESFGLAVTAMFLLMIRTTIFFPAKVGILPELVPKTHLSMGNSIAWFSIFLAIIIGSVMGGTLFDYLSASKTFYLFGFFQLAVSIFDLMISLRIPNVEYTPTERPFPINPFGDLLRGAKQIVKRYSFLISILGLAWFWFLGSIIKSMLPRYGVDTLGLSMTISSTLYGFTAVGIALGCGSAGYLSKERVEIGLIPLASIGISLGLALMVFATSYWFAAVALTIVGFAAGLFIIPIYSYLHHYSASHERGRLFATANYFDTIGMLAAAAVIYVFGTIGLPTKVQFIAVFVATLGVTLFCLRRLPAVLLRFINVLLMNFVYRVQVKGADNIPKRGGALIVANHVSYIDGLLLYASLPRQVHFMIHHNFFKVAAFRWVFEALKFIPVYDGKRAAESIEKAQNVIRRGGIVFIFPEGTLTRTGNMQPFRKGLERIMAPFANNKEEAQPPIIPMYLDRVWGSLFSFERGRVFFKMPRKFPSRVTLTLGAPLEAGTSAWKVREAVQNLGAQAQQAHSSPHDTLLHHFLTMVHKNTWRRAIGSPHAPAWTYSRLYKVANNIAKRLSQEADAKTVAIQISDPMLNAAANVACVLAKKTAFNIPDHLEKAELNDLMNTHAVEHVLTAGELLHTLPPNIETINIKEHTYTTLANSLNILALKLLPKKVYHTFFSQGNHVTTTDTALLVYDAPSKKCLRFTHHNVVSSVQAFSQVFYTQPAKTVLATLPLSTIAGLNYNLWFPLLNGLNVIYAVDALREDNANANLERLVQQYPVAFMFNDYNFIQSQIISNSHALNAIDNVICLHTTEELQTTQRDGDISNDNVFEGLYVPEACGLVSVNVKDYEAKSIRQLGSKAGTLGHPLPGYSVMVVNDANEMLPPNQQGTLAVSSSSLTEDSIIINGYLKTSLQTQLDLGGFLQCPNSATAEEEPEEEA